MDKKIVQNTRSEVLLLNQKQKIERLKHRINVNSISSPSHEEILKAKHTISFNDDKDNDWRYSTFETSIASYLDEAPLILSNQWSFISGNQPKSLEIRNLIFQNESEINYLIVNSLIKANVLLKGESVFFLILRSKNVFSEDSVVISLTKEEFSQKVYLSLGVFVKPEYSRDNELLYKVFSKQQLIISQNKDKESDISIAAFVETDSSSINLKLIDTGNESITVSAYMNNNKFENTLTGSFFLPTIDKKRVMIAGSGTQCKIKDFSTDCFYKENYLQNETNLISPNLRGCDCCNIF